MRKVNRKEFVVNQFKPR